MGSDEECNLLVSLDDYEIAAKSALGRMAYEYLASGAANDNTMRRNRAAFDEIGLLPRVLRDVSGIDTRVELFGRAHASPLLLAPTGYHKLFHAAGELETVRGANLCDTTLVASSFSTVKFEEMSEQAGRPLWFQLYVQQDRGFTRDIVERVVSAGCEAICITVDLAVNSVRDREQKANFCLPEGMTRENLKELDGNLASAPHQVVDGGVYNAARAANVTWKDLDWLRSIINIPFMLKGVTRVDDARTSISAGCDGVIVSNHGGRSVDGIPGSIELLRPIADELQGDAVILMDGGVRRGTDLLKAMACGADAVLIGRPYLFGLAINGARGVADVTNILRAEFAMSMGLCGCSRVADIDAGLLLFKS